MSLPSSARPAACPISHGPPGRDVSFSPISGPEFAVDPHAVYREMRHRHGDLVPVDVGAPATLVTSFQLAVDILHQDDRYPADPQAWSEHADAGSRALVVLGPRADALHTSGDTRLRLRKAIVDSLTEIDTYAVEASVAEAAVRLINQFCQAGEADLVAQFARPLVAETMHRVLGFAPDTARIVLDALIAVQTADPPVLERGRALLREVGLDTAKTKRRCPGADVASWLTAHSAGLTDEEIADQLVLLSTYLAPTWALIGNAILLSMTDDRFGGEVLGGALSAQEAIDEVLHAHPPVSIAAPRFPRQMQVLDQVGTLHENQPLLVGLAACHADPAVVSDNRKGNRAHLAFGAGAHACPAASTATLIARTGLDQLWDALPELQLTTPAHQLEWVNDPFARALTQLPARFPPARPFRLP
ncbi:hypothetical protein A5780_32420 [Nocardia sp. 852002-20019_SCH5090214]|uniref:cytochrome P450 n=1 Tax=Nocardia TaxID=1817 RepID=UPI0007C708C7|nr:MULTISPECIES: cytochrome P450 [Nocardia]MCC3311403.1 cytochrome P450 [Nocardia africana]OBA49230.1 hypothetical protein A5780_32420 [Nocardia sp. 852002-20019_SCH5090214]